MKFTPRPYQRRAVQFLLEHPRCNLWADMGSGKTPVALTAIDILLSFGEVQKVLIVAPLRVALVTWPEECQKWDEFQHLDLVVIAGTPTERTEKLKYGRIHIINYEQLPWLFSTVGAAWDYDMVLLDEPDKAKAPDSIRFKGKAKKPGQPGHPGLRWARDHVTRWVNMGGTPAPNGEADLWTQAYFLDPALLGRTLTEFRRRYFVPHPYVQHVWTIRPEARAEIRARLAPVSLTISPKDFTDLPPLVETVHHVPLAPAESKRYRTLQKDFFLQLEEGGEKLIAQALNLSQALLQYTSGFLYREDGSYSIEHTHKLDALEDLVEAAQGPVLIAHHFQAEREQILKRLPQAQVLDKKPDTIARWNRGEIPVLLLHPASAGHGLSLQHGGNQMIFFSLDWNLGNYQQVIERIGPMRQYQSGLDRPCFIHYLVSPDTIDEIVLDRLQSKGDVQDLIKSAMKRLEHFN